MMLTQHPFSRRRRWPASLFLPLVLTGLHFTAPATPQWSRSTGLSCIECHVLPPKLSARGEAFLARGYRLPSDRAWDWNIPMAVWLTGRYEQRSLEDLEKFYLPKVELISGGPMGDLPLSYFVEWRVVSLDLRADGTLRDRGGRFEDAFVNWDIDDRHSFTVGQYRSLNQYDVSLRLSVSEPAVFSASLPGDPSPNPRIQALRAFAPSARSPGFSYAFHSVKGRSASDGLFHLVTVPFVGELSIPLSDEARREASFELQGPPKGVFLETFYRRGLNSVGAHGFLDGDRWLGTGVGRGHYRDFYLTAAFGFDGAGGRRARGRYSFEAEYVPACFEAVRPGAGFRIEHVSHGRGTAYIPYFAVSGPNTTFTFLLQVEGRFQGESRGVFIDLSALF